MVSVSLYYIVLWLFWNHHVASFYNTHFKYIVMRIVRLSWVHVIHVVSQIFFVHHIFRTAILWFFIDCLCQRDFLSRNLILCSVYIYCYRVLHCKDHLVSFHFPGFQLYEQIIRLYLLQVTLHHYTWLVNSCLMTSCKYYWERSPSVTRFLVFVSWLC